MRFVKNFIGGSVAFRSFDNFRSDYPMPIVRVSNLYWFKMRLKNITMNKKEDIIDIVRDMGQICPDCGSFFIGSAISASTENGNYGIYFDEVKAYPLACGRCPECARECFRSISEYVLEKGIAPCVRDRKSLRKGDDESVSTYVLRLKERGYVECYPYTYDYQNYHLQYGTGEIPGGKLMDLTDILLENYKEIRRFELEDIKRTHKARGKGD